MFRFFTLKYSIAFLFSLLIIAVLSQDYLRRALRYNFADLDDYKIFENRIISAADGEVLPRAEMLLKEIPDKYAATFHNYDPVAFLILKDDSVIFENYWNDHEADAYAGSFSMAKSIVSLLIGIAVEEGHIESVQQRVSDFIPYLHQNDTMRLTIEHLLTMSSGIDWDESYSNPFSVTTRAYYGSDLESIIDNISVIEKPGERYEYLSGNTLLLGKILEIATGRSLSDYAAEKLWQPIAATKDALWSVDREGGLEKAYCCFTSTASDFARLGKLILQNGRWKDKQVVPRAYIESALSPARHLNDIHGAPVGFYGYHFWIWNDAHGSVPMFRGILGQYIMVFPKYNAVAVRLGHRRAKDEIMNFRTDVPLYIDIVREILNDYDRQQN